MDRSEALQRAVIVREGSRTFIPNITDKNLSSFQQEQEHITSNRAKKHVRHVLSKIGDNNTPPIKKICVTGDGVIKQIKHLLDMKHKREQEQKQGTEGK